MSVTPDPEISASSPPDSVYDVIVVGGGNAGFTAASTAVQTLRSQRPPNDTSAPKVLLIEKAPRELSGGNTYHTAGAYRFTFDSLSDLLPILSQNGKPGLEPSLIPRIEMPAYREQDFLADMYRVSKDKTDPALAEILVRRSREAVEWIHSNGGKWELSFHRQAYEVDGKFRFWGGLVVCFTGGGQGLMKWHEGLAEREGVEVWYDCAMTDLITSSSSSSSASVEDKGDGVVVNGVEVHFSGAGPKHRVFSRGGVILASGGYQASSELRAKYLGPQWTNAHVRGNPYSTGDALTMISSPSSTVRAKRHGDFSGSGCHSVCWDAMSPADGGDRVLTNAYTKSGYPLGIMVNLNGERFVDEGADLRNYTYAVFGREVLKQPHGRAWQVWDDDGVQLLRGEEYGEDVTRLVVADSIEELAEKMAADAYASNSTSTSTARTSSPSNSESESDREMSFNTTNFLKTVQLFNSACHQFQTLHPGIKFNPAARDGLSTDSQTHNDSSTSEPINPPKSNWARSLTKPPFLAVQVTCGITFTFGGLAVVPETGQVIREHSVDDTSAATATSTATETTGEKKEAVTCLYACGEVMGGLFWENYPGGSGLTAGTVWGRITGKHAALNAHAVSSGSKMEHDSNA